MPRLVRVEIWTDFAAAGGTVVDDIPDIIRPRATFNVEQPDQECFEFSVPVTSRVASLLTPRMVVRPLMGDGTFTEWRLNFDVAKPIGGDGLISYKALPPIFALAECGLYYTTGAGGRRDFSFSMVDATPTAVLTALVIGAPECPAWMDLGTISASVLITIEGEFATPLAIWLAVRDAVRGAGIRCENRLRRNGSTSYLLDSVEQIGASAATPEFRASKQMLEYALTHDCTRQATRLIPRGPVDATGSDATIERARYKVTAVNGGTKRITVADEAGGAGPITYNDQWVRSHADDLAIHGAGWFVFRERTGRTFQILHTYAATQEIELADVSDMAAHSVTAPEWISLRHSEPLTGTRRLGQYNAWLAAPLEVTAIDGGAKTLALSGAWPSYGDPVRASGEWVDWKARRATHILSTTATDFTAGVLDVASVAGVNVNDIVLVFTGGGVLQHGIGVVDAIDGGATTLTLHARDAGAPFTNWTSGPLNVKVFRPVATQHLITASAAATDKITVDAMGTAAANDLVELLQPCQGTMPFCVESPTDRASYGVKVATLTRPETGETNGAPNACTRTWSNPANPPDGWTRTVIGGTPTHSQETTITRQGGNAWRVELARSPGGHSAKVTTPADYPHPIEGAALSSVRLKYQIPGGTLLGNSTITATARRVDRAGAVMSTPSSWTDYTVTLGGPEHSTLPDAQKMQRDVWLDLAFHGLDISTFANEGIALELIGSEATGAGSVEVIIDGIQITQTPTAPREEPALLVEFSEPVKMVQAANLELRTWAGAPVEFSMKAVDLAAVDSTLWAEDEPTLGGTVRAIDATRSVDLSLRLMQWIVDYHDPSADEFTLATLPRLLTDMLRGGGGGSVGGGSVSATATAVAVGGQGVSWAAIPDKPTTFPSTPHTHAWPDIVATADRQGPRIGAMVYSSGGDDQSVATGVAAVTVYPGTSLGGQQAEILEVFGVDQATDDCFLDTLYLYVTTVGYGVNVISSQTLLGAPRARTWTMPTTLFLALGGAAGNTYTIRIGVRRFNNA